MMPSPENVKLKLKRLNNTVKHVLHFIFAGQKLKIFNSIAFLIHNGNTVLSKKKKKTIFW